MKKMIRKKTIRKLMNFKMQTLIGFFSLATVFANAQCGFENLSYKFHTISSHTVNICCQFKVGETTSNNYEILLNNLHVKTSTYTTLSQNFNQKVSNADLENTCFTVDKTSFLSNNVLKIQDVADKNCALELVFDTYSLSSNFDPQHINVYPTAANQFFHIQKNEQDKMDCKIYDLLGNTIYEGSLISHLTTINTSRWQSGLYCVNLFSNDETISKRILIQH